jgi:hypothetical protein
VTRFRALLLSAIVLGLTVAPAAMAGSGYVSGGGGAQGDVASGVGGASSGGNLPFTGLDLALIVIGGVALLATGVLLRRAGRSGKASS